ncbi:hypothetical protein [Planobispora takensis]|uniref:hypothetical protein n=1 Tax=Planobispora takensis TaxID=1367882 RepID=UPI001940F4AF|nr:hypothetical protein [Planobispora takensis]
MSHLTSPVSGKRADRLSAAGSGTGALGLAALASSALAASMVWGGMTGLIMAAVQAVALLRLTALLTPPTPASGDGLPHQRGAAGEGEPAS